MHNHVYLIPMIGYSIILHYRTSPYPASIYGIQICYCKLTNVCLILTLTSPAGRLPRAWSITVAETCHKLQPHYPSCPWDNASGWRRSHQILPRVSLVLWKCEARQQDGEAETAPSTANGFREPQLCPRGLQNHHHWGFPSQIQVIKHSPFAFFQKHLMFMS